MPTRSAGTNTIVVMYERPGALLRNKASVMLIRSCPSLRLKQCACLQEARCDDCPICNDDSTGDCEEEGGAAQQTAQGLVGARQLIVDAVELLQVCKAVL